jgi:hypothetical protein
MFADDMLSQWIEAPCPGCSFMIGLQYIDGVTRVWKWCPCCRRRVRFDDVTGSMATSVAGVQEAVDKVMDALRRIGR